MANKTVFPPITELAFKTERLSVQHWCDTIGDQGKREHLLEALDRLLTENVLKDLPPSLHLDNTPESISNWVDARAQESDCFLVRNSKDGAVLGILILVEGTDTGLIPTLHLGYLFRQDAWGQGYATELVAGVLDAAKSRAPLRFIGGVSKTNPASAHILQKLGFMMLLELSTDDTDMFTMTVI